MSVGVHVAVLSLVNANVLLLVEVLDEVPGEGLSLAKVSVFSPLAFPVARACFSRRAA